MAQLNASTAANWLPSKWRPGFSAAANEERVLTYRFFDATEGASRGINNRLYLRKLGTVSATTGVTTGNTSLTYSDVTDLVPYIDPSFDYAAVEVGMPLLSKLENDTDLQVALKKQLMAALAVASDTRGAVLVSTLTTNIKGNGGVNLDKSLFYDALNSVLVSGKDRFQPGKTKAYCVLYNKQAKHLWNIAEFTQAYLRGDEANPIVRGWVNEAMNTVIEESGTIYTAAGVAYNVIMLPQAFAIAYNMKAQPLDAQQVELVTRLIAVQEDGVCVYWDTDAAQMQTSDT